MIPFIAEASGGESATSRCYPLKHFGVAVENAIAVFKPVFGFGSS
jgi:hypothetical protein